MCKGADWHVSETVYELREYNEGNLVVGGVPIFPVIPVSCTSCGNSVFVNALMSDAIEQEPNKQ